MGESRDGKTGPEAQAGTAGTTATGSAAEATRDGTAETGRETAGVTRDGTAETGRETAGATRDGTAAAGGERLDPGLIKLAAVLLVGAIAALLDTTIVNVALRTIGHDLHAPLAQVQWIMTGYLLSYGMVIPLSGWLLARFGGRAVWLAALSIFLAASVAAGASWNIGSLITF